MNQGLYDALLGDNIFKKRLARKGQGKRGGYRTILAFKANVIAIFLIGYARKDSDGIDSEEIYLSRVLARKYLEADKNTLENLLENKKLIEVKYGPK